MASPWDYVIHIFGFTSVAALSIYKLIQMYRHRNDPAKFQGFLNRNNVLFPEKIRRLMFDEKYNEKQGIGRANLRSK